jgi:hypothetical protein
VVEPILWVVIPGILLLGFSGFLRLFVFYTVFFSAYSYDFDDDNLLINQRLFGRIPFRHLTVPLKAVLSVNTRTDSILFRMIRPWWGYWGNPLPARPYVVFTYRRKLWVGTVVCYPESVEDFLDKLGKSARFDSR